MQDDNCLHLNFEAYVTINRITDAELWSADLRARCADCGMVVRWLGVEPAIGGGTPSSTIIGDELSLPCVVDLPAGVWGRDGELLDEADRKAIAKAIAKTFENRPPRISINFTAG